MFFLKLSDSRRRGKPARNDNFPGFQSHFWRITASHKTINDQFLKSIPRNRARLSAFWREFIRMEF
jgi:hypothetical protein